MPEVFPNSLLFFGIFLGLFPGCQFIITNEDLTPIFNDELQADVAGFIRELLRKCDIA